ncbi:unnamed protein product [Calicophoron daubneyi]|uniref:PNPLA domain-containing protein n=1 Tax=Calicophoron daubneyi TaxID=300641 RepID=A0AAV2TMX2_CALDB
MLNRPMNTVTEDRYYPGNMGPCHNLSFAGCGFLGLYHVGVCCCLRKFAPHLYKNKCISGCSAGAIAAVCLVCDVNIDECVQYTCELIDSCRQYFLGPFDPRFKVSDHLKEGLARILPSDAHVLCSGRLSISLTSYGSRQNVVVRQFKDRDELISAVLCSTHIPVFSGFMPLVFRGEPVIDGGFSNNLLCTDQMTITVSPFAGDADICPLDSTWNPGVTSYPQHIDDILGKVYILNNSVRLSLPNLRRLISVLWPLSREGLTDLACQGYQDAMRYLTVRGFIACRLHRLPMNFSKLTQWRRNSINESGQRLRRRPSAPCLGISSPSLPLPRGGGCKLTSPEAMRKVPSLSSFDMNTVANLIDSGMGINAARCAACQAELCRALNSRLPEFVCAIVRGDVKYKRPKTSYSLLNLCKRGWNLFQGGLREQASQLCHTFYFPVFIQLSMLIGLTKMSIGAWGRTNEHLLNLHETLTAIRDQMLSWKTNLCDDSMRRCSSSTCIVDTSHSQSRFEYSTSSSGHYYVNPSSSRRTLLEVPALNRGSLSDLICPVNHLELPSAEECGLELFGVPCHSGSLPDVGSL